MKIFASASLVALVATSVHAGSFTDNFDGAPPIGFTRTTGAETGGTTTFVASDAAHGTSLQIQMPDVDAGYGRVTLNSPTNEPIGKLRDVSATFETFIDASSDVVLPPYVLLGLDNNNDGQYDSNTESLVIQFSSQNATPTAGAWVTETFDGSNNVHVVVDRGGLAAGDYSPDSTPDKLSDLYSEIYSGTTLWGDLNVFRVRIAAGFFNAGAGDQDYTALVDNLSVTAVPEPTTLAVLGLGVLGLLRRRVVR
jgi:hypothetical protein